MSTMNYKRVEDVLWTFRWNLENKPVVLFQNPNLCSKVKYSVDELKKILDNGEGDSDFIPVPLNVMQTALSVWEFQQSEAA